MNIPTELNAICETGVFWRGDEMNNYIGGFKLNKIYHMDCLDFMKRLPDKCIDVIITDPPYGIRADMNQQKAGGSCGWRKYNIETDWDLEIPRKEIFDEMFRVSKNQIIWGGNYFTEFLPARMGWLIWDKGQRDFSLADGELAWTSFNKALRIFSMSRSQFKHGLNEKRQHPTQKPLKLGIWILDILQNKFKEEVNIVYDPFAGSGSFLLACKSRGIKFIGTELIQEYVDIANKRLQQEVLFK